MFEDTNDDMILESDYDEDATDIISFKGNVFVTGSTWNGLPYIQLDRDKY